MSRTKPHPGGSAGFTLVEVMVALTLLAVGVLATGQIFAVSSRHTAFSRTETKAISLAREIAEKIQSESVDQVKSMFDGVDTVDQGSITAPCVVWASHLSAQLGPSGRGRIRVWDADEDPGLQPRMLSVRIEISWTHRGESLIVPMDFALTDIGA